VNKFDEDEYEYQWEIRMLLKQATDEKMAKI